MDMRVRMRLECGRTGGFAPILDNEERLMTIQGDLVNVYYALRQSARESNVPPRPFPPAQTVCNLRIDPLRNCRASQGEIYK